jgi:hypothetical protein
MKTLKMSLENIQGKMSRKEMRNIMAGSGGSYSKCTKSCSTNSDCSNFPNSSTCNTCISGKCGMNY